jgi:hypothetical protein
VASVHVGQRYGRDRIGRHGARSSALTTESKAPRPPGSTATGRDTRHPPERHPPALTAAPDGFRAGVEPRRREAGRSGPGRSVVVRAFGDPMSGLPGRPAPLGRQPRGARRSPSPARPARRGRARPRRPDGGRGARRPARR